MKWPLVRWIQRMLWICFWKERKNQSAAEANMMKLKSQWKMFGKYVIDFSSAWPRDDLYLTSVSIFWIQLFVELNELVDNSDNQILRISNQMSNTENYVSSGNEHLEMAIHLKRSADKKKAILMTVGLSTVGFGFIFALSYIVILLW